MAIDIEKLQQAVKENKEQEDFQFAMNTLKQLYHEKDCVETRLADVNAKIERFLSDPNSQEFSARDYSRY